MKKTKARLTKAKRSTQPRKVKRDQRSISGEGEKEKKETLLQLQDSPINKMITDTTIRMDPKELRAITDICGLS